jgi:hypothetical protein
MKSILLLLLVQLTLAVVFKPTNNQIFRSLYNWHMNSDGSIETANLGAYLKINIQGTTQVSFSSVLDKNSSLLRLCHNFCTSGLAHKTPLCGCATICKQNMMHMDIQHYSDFKLFHEKSTFSRFVKTMNSYGMSGRLDLGRFQLENTLLIHLLVCRLVETECDSVADVREQDHHRIRFRHQPLSLHLFLHQKQVGPHSIFSTFISSF